MRYPADPPTIEEIVTNLGITSIYLQGIDNTVHARRAPMVPADSSLAL